MTVDLRSDILSPWTPAMIGAMTAAAAAPFEFELRGDPRQQAVERHVAELLGQPDALVFPTCTMANQVGLMLLTRPGEIVAAPREVHIATSEAGAPAALSGVAVTAVAGEPPCPPVEAWQASAGVPDPLRARVSVFALENTHNRAGGAVIAPADIAAVAALARRQGIGLHLDGSRILQAAAALGCAPAELAGMCDTVSISLNKGLGSPIAAALAGSRALIERALTLRQRLGGGIRPTGAFAAATLVALDGWRDRLRADQARAQRLAAGLAKIRGLDVPPPPTNIVAASGAFDAPALCATLAARDVLALPFGAGRIRLVLCGATDDAGIERAIAEITASLP
jgi:threonine aldolase